MTDEWPRSPGDAYTFLVGEELQASFARRMAMAVKSAYGRPIQVTVQLTPLPAQQAPVKTRAPFIELGGSEDG